MKKLKYISFLLMFIVFFSTINMVLHTSQADATTVAPGVVADYPFDKSATNIVDGVTASAYSISYPSSPFSGFAAAFDGSNSYVVTNINLASYNQFSVSVWFELTGKTSRQMIVAQDAKGDRVFTIEFDPNKPAGTQLYSYDGAVTIQPDPSLGVTLQNYVWYNVVVIHSPTDYGLYLNGALIASTNTGINTYSSGSLQTLHIGNRVYSTSQDFLQGNIDEVRVFSKILSSTDISNIYNNLVAQYTFNGAVSDSNNIGQTFNPISYTINGYATSPLGEAAIFDGAHDHVDTGINLASYKQFTVSVWFKLSADSNRQVIVGQDAQNDRVFTIEYDPNKPAGTQLSSYDGAVTIQPDPSLGVTLQNNVWYHVEVTHSSSYYNMYLNGVLIASTNTGINTYTSGQGGNLHIGNRVYSGAVDYFDGQIDQVNIYDKFLNPQPDSVTITDLHDIAYNSGGVYLSWSDSVPLKNSLWQTGTVIVLIGTTVSRTYSLTAQDLTNGFMAIDTGLYYPNIFSPLTFQVSIRNKFGSVYSGYTRSSKISVYDYDYSVATSTSNAPTITSNSNLNFGASAIYTDSAISSTATGSTTLTISNINWVGNIVTSTGSTVAVDSYYVDALTNFIGTNNLYLETGSCSSAVTDNYGNTVWSGCGSTTMANRHGIMVQAKVVSGTGTVQINEPSSSSSPAPFGQMWNPSMNTYPDVTLANDNNNNVYQNSLTQIKNQADGVLTGLSATAALSALFLSASAVSTGGAVPVISLALLGMKVGLDQQINAQADETLTPNTSNGASSPARVLFTPTYSSDSSTTPFYNSNYEIRQANSRTQFQIQNSGSTPLIVEFSTYAYGWVAANVGGYPGYSLISIAQSNVFLGFTNPN